MTFLSRLTGFTRDMLMAVLFGASAGMDAFLIAYQIPNFFRRMFGEGAFSQAFVPVLGETKSKGTQEDVRGLVSVVAGTLGGVLTLITILGILAAPVFILMFAPGFLKEPGKYDLAVELLRITFPYLLFICLTALAGGVLNTYRSFAIPAFTPVLMNLSMIGAAIWLAPFFEQPVMALAVGVFIAGVAQLIFQFPFLRRIGMLPRPRWGWRDSRVRRILKLMIPILFASSVAQLSLMINTVIASMLMTGSVSWLYFADRLMEFPLGIFSVAIATVILPTLSARHAEASSDAFSHTLDWALRLLLLIVVPATVAMFVLAGPMIATLFQYKSFTAEDTVMTRNALMAYSVGLLTFSLVKVLLPGYYARQDTRTPVRIGVQALFAGMVMSVVFVLILKQLNYSSPHAGLALATSLGALVNAALLYRGLRQSGVYQPMQGWLRFGSQIISASLVMGVILWFVSGDLAQWIDWTLFERAWNLALMVVGGLFTYAAVLYITGLRPRHLTAPQH